ncbi:MAG: hypothetical protein ACFCD0_22795 [Gemmataceae bacterium]
MSNSKKNNNSKAGNRPPRKKKPTPKQYDPNTPKPPKVIPKKRDSKVDALFTLEVLLTGGPVTNKFMKENPVVTRTIEIEGHNTLTDLHYVIYDAFDRYDEHLFEFQMGKRPMAPNAKKYVTKVDPLGGPLRGFDDESGDTDKAKIGLLSLKPGSFFWYWFDFGDDWWHKISVKGIGKIDPEVAYPRITETIGKSPPQYGGGDEDEDGYNEEEDLENEESNEEDLVEEKEEREHNEIKHKK